MRNNRFCARRVLVMAFGLLSATLVQADVLQVGAGGMTAPAGWSSGATVTDGFTALTADASKFGALYDSGSGRVGGGAVAGDLYYAFTARSLDRAGGNPYIPTNTLNSTPYGPGTSFGGGQLIGASPSLNIGAALGFWAYSYSIGANGEGTRSDLSPRFDISPARVELFEVHVHYNADAADNATVVIRIYDNLPGQRQPYASDVPVGTYTNTLSNGDYAFSSFRFASGHADTTPYTRWHFSHVAFAQSPGEASGYVLTHIHNPAAKALIQLGTGGGTNEVAACSPATNFVVVTALTVDPASFGSLHDSASGRVGGGMVSGEVFYAFTARSLDRTGDTCLPVGSSAYVPNSPGNSCGGGQLAGANPSLGLGQKYGNWGMGFFTATNGAGGGDFGPRIDTAIARVSLFEVRLKFNPSANDTATVTKYAFDNLPGQRQPTAADLPAHVRALTVSGDFSFDRFQFVTGHTEAKATRWAFSNVVFTRDPATAALYLLDPPPPYRGTLISVR